MTNGEKFGDQRTKAWQRLVFSTCVQSFNDGVGLLAKRWHRDGDIFGANHLIGLGTTSDVQVGPIPMPVHRKWCWGEFEPADEELSQRWDSQVQTDVCATLQKGHGGRTQFLPETPRWAW